MQSVLNLRKSQIEKTLKFLTVESPSPITKMGSKWQVTAAASTFRVDHDFIDSITRLRRQEQQQMHEYMQHTGCLMAFLQEALDDPSPVGCGKCKNCNHGQLLDETYDDALSNRAALFLRRSYQPLEPRKQWPPNNPLPNYGFSGRIIDGLQASEGRALSLWRDAGWGQLVARGKYQTNRFSDELVSACVEMLHDWVPEPAPAWVTCIPSLNHPELVPDFAARLASALCLPYISCIDKIRANRPQKEMENSFQQTRNLDGIFRVNLETVIHSPCLLIDDMVDSRWTFTVASALLRQAGCTDVYPMALALNSPRMD